MMSILRGCVSASLVAGAVVTLAAQSFDLRLGQWEYTVTMQQPEAELAKLPPAARAQMEAMFKKPVVTTDCLTAEDLKDLSFNEGDKSCKVTSSKMTRTTADVTRRCDGPPARTETMSAVAASRESVRATMSSVSATGKQTLTVTGRWLSATCKEGQ